MPIVYATRNPRLFAAVPVLGGS